MAAKKKPKSKSPETTLRHVWLAGLGVVAVARRESRNAAQDAVSKVVSLRRQAGGLVADAQANVAHGLASVREQGEATASRFSAEVEARIEPVLVKLGLKPQPKASRARKSTRKPAAKRTRATPARKPAAKRAVRKARR